MAVSAALPIFAKKTEKTMMKFKSYPSIGNVEDATWMARVREAVPAEALWAVQEKVHGANVSFLCDDLDVRMARRTAVLAPEERFFGYQEVLERYSGQVYHVFNRVRLSCPRMTAIALYGELFGGSYPHPDVVQDPARQPVQQGVHYAPGYDFYAFDLYVFTPEGGFFLPVAEATALFSAAGFLYARNLYIGRLDDCLNYPCVFPTTLPTELFLPSLEGNFCEGIIIKPLVPVLLGDGTRICIKKKNPAFSQRRVRVLRE